MRCLWALVDGPAAGEAEADLIVPDGCAEIILNRAERFERHLPDAPPRLQSSVLLVGALSAPIRVASTGGVDLLGARLEPGGLHGLLGVPAHELSDRDLCVSDLDPGLHAQLESARTRSRRAAGLQALQRALLQQFERRAARPGLVWAALRLVESGARSVDELSARMGVHRRALERSFRRELGLTPKHLLRIQRLQGVLARLEEGPAPRGWAQLALEHGFSDQSHLIRDFRLLAGNTPQRYLEQRTDLARVFEAGEVSHPSNS